jgi:hypothetical protein
LLYETYRVDSVELSIEPASLMGLGGVAPFVSVADVVGSGQEPLLTLADLAKGRTALIHSPYRKVTRSLDYSTWLSQNVAKPYLLTALPTGRRERY